MPASNFTAQLDQYGPARIGAPRLTVEQARDYCRRLAGTHYENFTVASWLLPRQLRQHFCNIYAYCRWADDLADETGDRRQSLELLDWWQQQLADCYRGRSEHPVFVALADTIERFEIPEQPLVDLLTAFRQDQRQTRYETFDELLGYCRNSANPVGRLVLYLGRCHDDANVRLSDSVCTGLQLANFWQDVRRDDERGRIYLPQEDCRRFDYSAAMFERRECNDAFRKLLAFQVERAGDYLSAGWPLVGRVPRELRIDVALFIRGGLAILGAIASRNHDVWSRRPVVSKLTKVSLLLGTWLQHRAGRLDAKGFD